MPLERDSLSDLHVAESLLEDLFRQPQRLVDLLRAALVAETQTSLVALERLEHALDTVGYFCHGALVRFDSIRSLVSCERVLPRGTLRVQAAASWRPAVNSNAAGPYVCRAEAAFSPLVSG